ncbi:MAG: PQQ-binding-like beta-propeller repeat protein [Anaerolineae bacterium]|nr:PQQ-binding-like beta-propeller repeat protein [Anaerolineae bacterium]
MASTARPTDRAYLAYLRRLLVQRFDLSELRTVCFDLAVDAESLAGTSRGDLARELIDYLESRRRIPELLAYIRQTRGDIALAALPEAAPVYTPTVSSPEALAAVQKPMVAWSVPLPGQPMASPVVLGDTCLVACQASGRAARGAVLRALDLATGELRWEQIFGNAVVGGIATLAPDRAVMSLPYLGPMPGECAMVAIETNGHIVWRTDFDIQQISAPAVGGGLVAMAGNSHHVAALDAEAGDMLLDISAPVDVAMAAPACDGETIYVPCRVPSLLAFDREGDLRWRFDVEGVLSGVQLNQTPLVADPFVIAVLSSGMVVALTRDKGRLIWETQVGPRGKQLTPAVTDGRRVFVGARDGVYALRLKDGAHQWVFRTGAYVTAPPVIAGDVLCIAGNDRHLYGVDRRTGALLWQATMPQETKSAPALAAGDGQGPYVITVDCTGRATALSYPVPAVVHEEAGRWQKAALVWEGEGDLLRAAEAWVAQAEALAAREGTVDQQAEAWTAAAQLFAAARLPERADEAQRRYAACLELPVLTVKVEHDGLALDAWSQLRLVVENLGYGLARDVVVRAAGEQFEGQIAETQALASIPQGKRQDEALTVKPLAHGDAVPLTLQLSYLDKSGEPHRREETLLLNVSRNGAHSMAESYVLPANGGAHRVAAAPPEPLDVEIRIRQGRRDYDVELTLNSGQVFSGGRLSQSILEWVPSGDLEQDGRYLFETLLRDRAVRRGWDRAEGQAEQSGAHRRLRLRIDADASELQQLPWELLHDESVMLAACETTPFSRYIPVDQPWGRTTVQRPIRILAAIANPRDVALRYDLPSLNVELERYILAAAFAEIDPAEIQLTFLKPPVTLERLSRMMLEGYEWLHFVGHGRVNPRQARVDLLMEDAQGNTRAIADRLFAATLARQGVQPQLVFLSTCQSAVALEGHALSGLAPQLVRIGVPAVVAMRGKVPMRTAQKVTQRFYQGLVEDGVVDRALNRARDDLVSAQLPGVATPILYMRLPSGALWESVVVDQEVQTASEAT